MPNEEQMTINERRKYLRLIKKRYLKAGKLERGRLLDEPVLARPVPPPPGSRETRQGPGITGQGWK